MTNYHLLGQTKLAKMAEEYLTCFVRGDPCEQASSSCLVQIISTNPFEISDNSHHIRVRDPSHILEALRKINANINLLSMKGALILLKKWHIESQYLPLKNEVKLDVVIEEVEYIDGLGTSELVMDTVPILEIPSLKNKFRRLRKHLQAQEFDSFHPIEEMLEMLDNQNFKNSEKIRKADLRMEKPIETTLEGRVDPFLIWSHDQYTTKSSVTKSQASQISDFEVLSINSQTQNRYSNVRLKSSVPKRPFQSLPVGNNAFALDFNQLSSDPLIQKMQIDEELDLGVNPGTMERQQEQEEQEQIVIDDRSDKDGDATEIIDVTQSEERSFIKDFIQKMNYQEPEIVPGQEEKETPNKQRQQQFKRNFHDMIKNNPMPGSEGLEQETKKVKYQWGPNHKKEQQKFRAVLEGRRSFSKGSPEGDILELLASSQLRVGEIEEEKGKEKDNVILLEEDEKQGRIEIEEEEEKKTMEIISPVRRGKDSGERAIDEVNEMIYQSRRMSTPTLGPKIPKESKNNDFYALNPNPKENSNKNKQPVQKVNHDMRIDYLAFKANQKLAQQSVQPMQPVQSVQKINQDMRNSFLALGPKPVQKVHQQVVVEKIKEPAPKTMREKERPMSFGRPQDSFTEVRELRSREEINKKEKAINQINQINRRMDSFDGYKMIGEKENNKSIRTKGFIDLTHEDRSPKGQYSTKMGAVNGRNHHNNESSVFTNARRLDSGVLIVQKEVKKKAPKTIVNPFDPTKSFDMSEFADLSRKPKKSSTMEVSGNSKTFGNGNGYGQKRNQTIHIL